jgi:hypothetical protein
MRRWRASSGAIFTAFFIFVLSAVPALAWGSQAHRAIALIADRLLQQSDPA